MWKLIKTLFYGAVMLTALVLVANIWMVFSTESLIYSTLDTTPYYKTGLVLGTSKSTTKGTKNQFFEERINAAAKLFLTGKIDHIIVSGDNRTKYYNEPRDMLNALVERGIPAESVTLDYAGYRTLDSVVRSKSIFGQTHLIIITQKFHCYRALYIAKHHGIQANAYAADDPDTFNSIVMIRETIARPLALLDLYIWNTEPEVKSRIEKDSE